MGRRVKGNTKGIAAERLKRIERLYRRRLPKNEIVSADFAGEILDISEAAGRKVGVLASREGRIEEVFVGSKIVLYLPDLGRYRYGRGRLRRLRLIYPELGILNSPPEIPQDIYTDLEKLRLDAVVSVARRRNGMMLSYAYILPGAKNGAYTRTERAKDLGRFKLDFAEFIDNLEDEMAAGEGSVGVSGRTSALLVGVYDRTVRDPTSSMAELKALANTAGVKVVGTVIQRRRPDPRTLIGKGKLEEVILASLRAGAEIIIFDTELKPGQWRSITNATDLKVLDRSMLILDIFAQHASSADGRLQVELAQLKYNLPRLVEKDAGLSRLTGEIGGRGPGETKLEIGRRRARDRIAELEKRIVKLSRQRSLRRKKRDDNKFPVAAILGYTNAGKSTLFNALTDSSVVARNILFATLDPTHRRLRFPERDNARLDRNRAVILTDTVGFLRELPYELVNAFKATLEELERADLLLHVVDGSDPECLDKKAAVEEILRGMNLNGLPTITVLNKVDRIESQDREELLAAASAVPVSALKGEGLDRLLELIEGKLNFM